MTERPFHHGNLRAALLDEAVGVLREGGVEALSLRDLARRAGVSHGAPRSHFVDRQALLEALAELGFERLTTTVRRALASDDDLTDRFHRVGLAYLDFAIDDAALMELMFQAKTTDRTDGVRDAAGALFATLDGALGPRADGQPDEGSRTDFKMLFAATLQGIASLVTSRRLERTAAERLVGTAMETMLGSELGARAISIR